MNPHTGAGRAGDPAEVTVMKAAVWHRLRATPSVAGVIHMNRKAIGSLTPSSPPELAGTVKTVAADLTQDTTTGESWYIARIAVAPDELAKLHGLTLVPGMPVEAFIQTGERTAASYLLKPLADQISRAFRED